MPVVASLEIIVFRIGSLKLAKTCKVLPSRSIKPIGLHLLISVLLALSQTPVYAAAAPLAVILVGIPVGITATGAAASHCDCETRHTGLVPAYSQLSLVLTTPTREGWPG